VKDEVGEAIEGAKAEVTLYLTSVGIGPHPDAPINFWLSRYSRSQPERFERLSDLSATTDGAGNFTIPEVPVIPRSVSLAVSHPEFARLELSHGPSQGFLDLTMRSASSVCLRVKLPSGAPAVGFSFNLEGTPEGSGACTHRHEMSDEDGNCEFTGLPAGDYTIYFLGATDQAWAVPAIQVPDLTQGERRDISVPAVRGSVLCGRVVDSETGAPIEYVDVRFESDAYPRTASTFQAACTDQNGEFRFRFAVAPGGLEVRASKWEGETCRGKRCEVEVEQKPETRLEFELPPAE